MAGGLSELFGGRPEFLLFQDRFHGRQIWVYPEYQLKFIDIRSGRACASPSRAEEIQPLQCKQFTSD